MRRARWLSLLLLLPVLLAAQGCGASPAPQGEEEPSPAAAYQTLSAEQAMERMDSGDPVIIVDVRTREEYEAGHVSGAILVPNETLSDTPPEALPDLDAELLVYCRSGRRSAEASQKLAAMGYTNVSDFGGILDWPYATVCGSEPEGAVCYVGNQ